MTNSLTDGCAGFRTIYMKKTTAQYLAKNDAVVLRGIILNNENCPKAPEAE